MRLEYIFVIWALIFATSCSATQSPPPTTPQSTPTTHGRKLAVGAAQLSQYLPLLENKKVAVVVNQTSTIGTTHLVDTLLSQGIYLTTVFAPEHGFRGKADAGETIQDGKDPKTQLPIISLYGKNKKPSAQQLKDIDIVIFDIQDVGTRFYTYISTMHYVMEACAENDIPFLVLDRPNPNGHYVDGPIREEAYQSFVGMHPIPIVHGLTVGELALMINGEGWLNGGLTCTLTVIPCANYRRGQFYDLPIKPSPNLPNATSILLYPSLCLFEGTTASVGRGTQQQFQVIGHPKYDKGEYSFTPTSQPGATHPKHQDKKCYGYDLSSLGVEYLYNRRQIQLEHLINFYNNFPDKTTFFNQNNFIDKLAGTAQLRKQIIAGKTAEEIRESWQAPLADYKKMRNKYLLKEYK